MVFILTSGLCFSKALLLCPALSLSTWIGVLFPKLKYFQFFLHVKFHVFARQVSMATNCFNQGKNQRFIKVSLPGHPSALSTNETSPGIGKYLYYLYLSFLVILNSSYLTPTSCRLYDNLQFTSHISKPILSISTLFSVRCYINTLNF